MSSNDIGANGVNQFNHQANVESRLEQLESLVRTLARDNRIVHNLIDQVKVIDTEKNQLKSEKTELEKRLFEIEQQLQRILIEKESTMAGYDRDTMDRLIREHAEMRQRNQALEAMMNSPRYADDETRLLREQVHQLGVERDQYKEWCSRLAQRTEEFRKKAEDKSMESSAMGSADLVQQLTERVSHLEALLRRREAEMLATKQQLEAAERRLQSGAAVHTPYGAIGMSQIDDGERQLIETENQQLTARLREHEELVKTLQHHIDQLQREGDVEVYKAAMNTYKEDFERERRDRERSQEKVDKLEEEIRRLRFERNAARRWDNVEIDGAGTRHPTSLQPAGRGYDDYSSRNRLGSPVVADGPAFEGRRGEDTSRSRPADTVVADGPAPAQKPDDSFKCPSCGKLFSRSKYHDFVDHCSTGCDGSPH